MKNGGLAIMQRPRLYTMHEVLVALVDFWRRLNKVSRPESSRKPGAYSLHTLRCASVFAQRGTGKGCTQARCQALPFFIASPP